MRKILDLIRMDLHTIGTNVIVGVVVFGLMVVPSIYAWFNIAGGWDPYGNTGSLPVAVANADEGYVSDAMPLAVNIGEKVSSSLATNDALDFEVVTPDEAYKGVESGKYYAAFVMRSDFTKSLIDSISTQERPTIDFYVNQKKNAIGSIVMNKASATVQSKINETLVKTVAEVGSAALKGAESSEADERLANVAQQLRDELSRSTGTIRTSAANVRSYGELIGSVRSLASKTTDMLQDTAKTTLADDLLQRSTGGIDATDGVVGDATRSALESLGGSLGDSLSQAKGAIEGAYDQISSSHASTREGLEQARTAVENALERTRAIEDAAGTAAGVFDQVAEVAQELGLSHIHDRAAASAERMHTIADSCAGAREQLQGAIDDLASAVADIDASKEDAAASRERAATSVADATGKVSEAADALKGEISTGAGAVKDTLDGLAGDANQIMSSIRGAGLRVRLTQSRADGALGEVQAALSNVASKLDGAANNIDGLVGRIDEAMASGDMEQLRLVLSSDPEQLAEWLSSPVVLERTAIFPVENNGSAMTPFYSAMSLWVGATIMSAIILVGVSEEWMERVGARRRHAYLSRLALFIGIGFIQATILCLGNMFILGVQHVEPVLFMVAGYVVSFTFVNIVFMLARSFGDVGKAIAVVVMIVQVAGSGGTFPREMLPPFFQMLYPVMPFVHAENAFRAAIAGVYDGDFWMVLLTLLAYVPIAWAIGLVLSKPFGKLNEWLEHQMESTKLM